MILTLEVMQGSTLIRLTVFALIASLSGLGCASEIPSEDPGNPIPTDDPAQPRSPDGPGAPTEPEPGGPSDPTTPNPENPGPAVESARMILGYQLPETAQTTAAASSLWAAEAVLEASRQAGGGVALVTTGTLRQLAAGTLYFGYESSPTDRLDIVLADGTTFGITVERFQGTYTAGGQGFLNNAHDLSFRVQQDGVMNLAITSLQSASGARQATIGGTLVHDGITFTVNLQHDGTYYFENDNTGTEYRTNTAYRGTIDGDSISIDVNETWQYQFVYSSSERVSASTTYRTANTTWSVDSTDFQLRDLQINAAFRDGRPHLLDTNWSAVGALVRNGQAYGTVEIGFDAYGSANTGVGATAIKVWLVVPEGPVEISSWQLR